MSTHKAPDELSQTVPDDNLQKEKYNYPSPMQGWECPKCGRVYSPFISMCAFCVPRISTTNITWEITGAADYPDIDRTETLP